MIDPVATDDGHRYERKAIETWLKVRKTSPKTNLRLQSTQVKPDEELQKRIRLYIETLPKEEQKPYWDAIKAKERQEARLAKEANADFQLNKMRKVYPFELDTYYQAYTSIHGDLRYYVVKFSKSPDNVLVMQCVPYVRTSGSFDPTRWWSRDDPVTDFSHHNLQQIRDTHRNENMVSLTTVVDPKMKMYPRRKTKVLYVYRCPRNSEAITNPLVLNGDPPSGKYRTSYCD